MVIRISPIPTFLSPCPAGCPGVLYRYYERRLSRMCVIEGGKDIAFDRCGSGAIGDLDQLHQVIRGRGICLEIRGDGDLTGTRWKG